MLQKVMCGWHHLKNEMIDVNLYNRQYTTIQSPMGLKYEIAEIWGRPLFNCLNMMQTGSEIFMFVVVGEW